MKSVPNLSKQIINPDGQGVCPHHIPDFYTVSCLKHMFWCGGTHGKAITLGE